MTDRPVIHVLTGCTACGKTAAALDWAGRHGAEIVSCDSLLFYRGLDVGTAKPTPDERARVPHHLIDILDLDQRMDVGSYVDRARAAITDLTARGRRVLVTGGSGFYLRSFLAPVVDEVRVDPERRADLERALAADGLEALVRRLQTLNPGGMGALDLRNPRRVVRALERCEVSGKSLRRLDAEFRAQPAPFAAWDVRVTEIVRTPDDLRRRVARRVHSMLEAGLVDEVRALRDRGLGQNPSAAGAIGYRETLAWLAAGRGDVDLLAAEIVRDTWQLVRKQRTWFRTQLGPHRTVSVAADEEADAEQLFPE
jgi:tRNA dimethylallyltransferase